MEILLGVVVIIIIFNKLEKTNNISNKKRILYSVVLFIPLFIAYYFIIAFVVGFILRFFGEYMFYYGIIVGIAFSPLASIITIFKINNKYKNKRLKKEE